MTEELKPIGGETYQEGTAPGEVERQPEVGPLASPEKATEQAPEAANEKFAEILSKAPVSQGSGLPTDDAAVDIDAKAIYDETDAEARVTKLVSLAETKGIEHAVRVARKLDDFYVLDRMHDELSGKFYDVLKERGLIREE